MNDTPLRSAVERSHGSEDRYCRLLGGTSHRFGSLLYIRSDGRPRGLIPDRATLALAPRLLRRLCVRQLG